LGLLSPGELTAVDIEAAAYEYLRFFYWTPALSHIRRELNRLEELGYVDCREVMTGRIKRTLKYWLTSAGEQALRDWVESTFVERTVQKNPAILRLWLGRRGADTEAVLEGLDVHVAYVGSERRSLMDFIAKAENSYLRRVSEFKGSSTDTKVALRAGLWRHAWVLEVMGYCLREFDNELKNLQQLRSDMRRLVAESDAFDPEAFPLRQSRGRHVKNTGRARLRRR
jgi:DNA-binding PadR family transcriptional regulator